MDENFRSFYFTIYQNHLFDIQRELDKKKLNR